MSEILTGEGVVNKVGSKKVGKRVYYNFTLEDDDTLYRTGTDRPDVDEGDEIVFDYEDGDYGPMVDLSTVEVTGQAAPRRKKKASSKNKSRVSRGRSAGDVSQKSSAKSSGNSKDDYWTKKADDDKQRQNIISFQAAYNTALAVLSKELDMGLVKLGTEKAAAPKKLAAFEALLAEKANALWADFCNAGNGPSSTKKVVDDDDVEDDMDDQVDDEDGEEDEDFDD